MNRTKYEHVLEACALKNNLELFFFYGDQTEIEERGINLSRERKKRIQLAHAIYRDANIYLIDNPFSVVDAHIGAQLFKVTLLTISSSK